MSRNMRHYFLAWSTFSVTFLWSEASDTVEHTYDGDPLLWLPLPTEDKTNVKKFRQEDTTHVKKFCREGTTCIQKIHIRRHNPCQEIQTRQCKERTGDWYPYNSVFTWSRKTCLYFVPETIMQHTYLQKSKSILNLIGKSNTVKTTTTTTTTTTFLPPAASHRSISSAERVLLQHGT